MDSLLRDLQQEVLKPDCDILNALRKAHLIAAKLKLTEFDSWIMSELNGYDDNQGNVPKYREIKGQLNARNPYYGWVPVVIHDSALQDTLCTRTLGNSIGNILELYNSSDGQIVMSYPGSVEKILDDLCDSPIPTNYSLHISKHILKSIIDKVGNCLLEWTIRLETEGILGEDMRFSQEETNMAKEIPQQINNYYGTVVNGDVSQSQVVSGDHNAIAFNYGQASGLMKKVRDSIEREQLSDEDRESAMELISEAETKIAEQKKPRIIQAALSGLRDFLVAGGANVTAALVVQYLQTL